MNIIYGSYKNMMWRFVQFDKRANEIYIQSIRMNVDWTRTGLSAGVSVVVNAAIKIV